MQRGEAQQALADGTRTQRDLQELLDDLRKTTSRQFTDEMRQMRTEARDLAERQRELGEKLAGAKSERRTLDGSGQSEQAAKAREKQRTDFTKITEDMKRVSEQAEAAEPLLARELYDTLRKSAQYDTARALEATQQL